MKYFFYPGLFFYYFAAFVQGASIMLIELAIAKIIGPYYGSTIYVWSITLGITLGGLAIGYYSGGYASKKFRATALVLLVITIAAVYISLIPSLSIFILEKSLVFNLILGIIIAELVLLLPPLILLGMSSPLIIRALSEQQQPIGSTVGNIYTISTAGGIISTFLAGYYLIPYHGLTNCLYYTAIALISIPALFFILKLISSNKAIRSN